LVKAKEGEKNRQGMNGPMARRQTGRAHRNEMNDECFTGIKKRPQNGGVGPEMLSPGLLMVLQ